MSITATFATIGTIGAMAETVEDLERRLRAGAWLRPGDVARVLDASRSTVVRMLTADPPLIRWRTKPGSRHRECHPEDVLRLLAERRRVHGDQ